MSAPCTHPGCFHLAAVSAGDTCAEHFVRESYVQVNDCSRLLSYGALDGCSMSEMKRTLYGIADRACLIAHRETITKIDQIRILELEELVGKTLCSMRALAKNQQVPLNRYVSAGALKTTHQRFVVRAAPSSTQAAAIVRL
jgi:hypothetical protein